MPLHTNFRFKTCVLIFFLSFFFPFKVTKQIKEILEGEGEGGLERKLTPTYVQCGHLQKVSLGSGIPVGFQRTRTERERERERRLQREEGRGGPKQGGESAQPRGSGAQGAPGSVPLREEERGGKPFFAQKRRLRLCASRRSLSHGDASKTCRELKN